MSSDYRVVRNLPPSRVFPWLFAAVLGALVWAAWPQPEQPGFRPLCEAQGGLVVRLEAGGRLCLWAGAVIPVGAP